MKPICLLDQDLTIADTYTPLIRELNRRWGLNLDPDWKKHSYFGDHQILEPSIERVMLDEVFSTNDFFLHLPVLPGAITAVKRLRKNFDVYVLTRPWDQAEHPYMDKKNWLRKYFPELADKIIPTACKHLVYGDVLVDDHMLFLKSWSSFWRAQRKKVKTASLLYPWTDAKTVDIVGENWTHLVNKIEDTFLGGE